MTKVAVEKEVEQTELVVSGLSSGSQVLAVYTSEDGLKNQVKQVADLVDNFDHNVKNLKGRNETKAFSAKIGKFKSKLEKLGKSLTDSEKAKIEDVQATIKLVNKNVKEMSDELAKLKVKARQPLTEWEVKKEAEKEAKLEAEKLEKIELLHELAIHENKDRDAEKVEAEKALAEQAELDRIANEKAIADQAVLDEKKKAQDLKFENDKKEKRLIQEKLDAEANTIHYWYHAESDDCGYVIGNIERDKIYSSVAEICTKEIYDKCMQDKADFAQQQQKTIDAENLRIQNENIAKQQVLDEQTRQAKAITDEAERVERVIANEEANAELLRLNNEHVAQVCGDLKRNIMHHTGCIEEQAKLMVLALRDDVIDVQPLFLLYPRKV